MVADMLGAGVVDRPYGQPSKFEGDVIRRNVPWLTASRESSVSFSPIAEPAAGSSRRTGLFFERYHAGRAGRRSAPASAADPRPGRAPAGADDGRHRAISGRIAHSFHRVSRQWRHGMARRTAQFAAVHPRHDRLRRMDRRQALDPAGRGRPQDRGEVGDGGRRRRRAHEPQPAARKMPRRLSRRLRARTARRCGPSRVIRCGCSCPAGRAMSASNGCAGSRSATSPGSRARRRRNTPT